MNRSLNFVEQRKSRFVQLSDSSKVKWWLFTTLHRAFLYLEDCSYKDIAAILDVPIGTG